jgi:hypothetical protein
MGQLDRMDGPSPDDDDRSVTRLGPPGWEEYAGARARFMRRLEVVGLETAWASPPFEPAGAEGEERRR